MEPKILTNLLILSTVGKDKANKGVKADLFDILEPEIMLRMRSMNLSDLINLMWSAQEIQRGNESFYNKLETEITVRIKSISEDDFQTLIECFSDNKSLFSEKFLSMIIKVVREKKD